MRKTAGMEMIGFDELDKMFRNLPAKVTKNVQRKAVRAGASVLLKEYRRNVKKLGKVTGTLRRSLAKKVKTYRRTATVVGIIGPKSRAAPHAHLVEFGTKPRYRGKKRKGERMRRVFRAVRIGGRWGYTGSMPAFAPLRRAFYSTLSKVKHTMRKKLADGIKAEALKLRKAA